MSARAGPSRAPDDATGAANAATASSTGSDGGGGQAGGSNATGSSASKKRSRVSRACDACYARKDRCDGGQPVCKVCRDLERPCTYDRPERKRGPLQGVRQRLEAQIEILESVLGYLVDSFPHLSHDALRPLMLDDGAAAMVKTEGDAHRDSPSATAAGQSRMPLGNIYPYYNKAHAKEVWRHSDLARSIAPSLGLRLGLLDDEEDVMESSVHQLRVEEARRARARLMMSTPPSAFVREHHASGIGHHQQNAHHMHDAGAFNGSAPFHLPHLQPTPTNNEQAQTQTHLQQVALMQHNAIVEASAAQHGLHAGGVASSAATNATSLPHLNAMHNTHGTHSEEAVDMDPFSAQWSHESFDLGTLGEGGHALAYALGLQTAGDAGGSSGSTGAGGHRAQSAFTFGADPSPAGAVGTSADESYAAPPSTQTNLPSVFTHAYAPEGLSPPVSVRSSFGYADQGGGGASHVLPAATASHAMLSALAGGSGGNNGSSGGQPTSGLHSSPATGRTMHTMDHKSGNFDAASVLHGAHPSPSHQQHHLHYPQHQHHRSEPASNILYQLGLQDSM